MLWRDAGLIALGLFRVIEVEINERLIRPVANSISMVQLDALIERSSSETQKSWKSALTSLRTVIANPEARLMLGPMRKMLDDFAHPLSHIDTNLRACIQAAFDNHLTAAGRSAFYSGELINTISSDRVNSYRNPPAHGRFVDIEAAKRCRFLVNNSLELYFSWFSS
jgi:hypothetical protein